MVENQGTTRSVVKKHTHFLFKFHTTASPIKHATCKAKVDMNLKG